MRATNATQTKQNTRKINWYTLLARSVEKLLRLRYLNNPAPELIIKR